MEKPRMFTFAGRVIKNLFQKPATTQYPFEPVEYPERMRGHIRIEIENCITCGLCMRSCPSQAIRVDRKAGTWTIERFDCVQCGFCVATCPKKCLFMETGYTEPDIMKKSETFTKPKEEKKDAPVTDSGKPVMDAEKCVYCTLCAKKCPQEAIHTLREEMSAGGDPCGEKREDLETGRGEMRGVRNLCGSMSEEGDRAKRVGKRTVKFGSN